MEIARLRTLSPAQQSELGERLRSVMVFKTEAARAKHWHAHGVYTALRLAFQESVFGDDPFHDVHQHHPLFISSLNTNSNHIVFSLSLRGISREYYKCNVQWSQSYHYQPSS